MSENANESLPMDVAVLLGQVGGSAATAEMVLDEFISQTPIDIRNIEGNLAKADLSAAGKVAHSLKGTSGVFGAHQLRQLAADMETVCRAEEADKAAELFPQLASEAKRCLDFIPQLKESLNQ